MLKRISERFWTDSMWLAPGYKWSDVTNGPDKNILYPEMKDFLYQIPLTALFLILRFLLEKYCFAPLGRALGIKQKRKRKLQDIPLLESEYRQSPQLNDVSGLAKQLDISERQVERWWRLRRHQDKTSTLAKFCEHSWKSLYLVCSTGFGFYMLWDKDWFWDLDKCFIGYPHQGVTNDVWWAYMLWSSFCWSALLTYFRDVKRKDFWQMFLHHVVACSLLSLSWISSMYRIGAVLMPMQDSSEAVLEITKAFKKAKYDGLCKVLFLIFAPLWFYTRVYHFPVNYLYTTIFRAMDIVSPFFIGILLDVMLLILLLLTIYWSALIVIVLYNFLALGVERDVRSSSSEVSEDEIASQNGNKNGVNGNTTKNSGTQNGLTGLKNRVNGNGYVISVNSSKHNNGVNRIKCNNGVSAQH